MYHFITFLLHILGEEYISLLPCDPCAFPAHQDLSRPIKIYCTPHIHCTIFTLLPSLRPCTCCRAGGGHCWCVLAMVQDCPEASGKHSTSLQYYQHSQLYYQSETSTDLS